MTASDTKAYQLPRLLKPRRLRQLLRGRTVLWYFSESATGHHNLDVYRNEPRRANSFWWCTPHATVVYSLWDAVTLVRLPDDLDYEEIAMARDSCELLMHYLTTDDCLSWVESGIIVNYSGQWPNFLGNAQTVLTAVSTSPVSDYEFVERYLHVRWEFFTVRAQVLAMTGPRDPWDKIENSNGRRHLRSRFPVVNRPLPVFQKIAALGEKYKYLVHDILWIESFDDESH
ncbi:hypothetical protein MMC18_002906 [Xylographa bjoerkii]|nr:hypothetical protein [Xylographa bjoerkii]